ncbi:hypothetical protein M5D96_004415, partial [Drosophila gunungcola]
VFPKFKVLFFITLIKLDKSWLIYSRHIGANQCPSSWGLTKHSANSGFRKGFMFGPLAIWRARH